MGIFVKTCFASSAAWDAAEEALSINWSAFSCNKLKGKKGINGRIFMLTNGHCSDNHTNWMEESPRFGPRPCRTCTSARSTWCNWVWILGVWILRVWKNCLISVCWLSWCWWWLVYIVLYRRLYLVEKLKIEFRILYHWIIMWYRKKDSPAKFAN